MLACLMLLLCGPAFLALFPGAAADTTPLPDLSPELYFFADGNETRGATAGTPVTIIVYVNNEGPGNITSSNLTLSVDGSLVTVVPVVFNFSGEGRFGAAYNWNTTALAAGSHTVRAEINDSAGDADPSDNAADYKFTVGRRSAGLMLELDASVAEAAVTESSPATATLGGSIVATDLGGQAMDISLSAMTDIGWTARLLPNTIHAGQDGRYRFSVEVTVPQASPSARWGKLVISALGRTPEDNLTATVEAIVKVRPYYKLSIGSDGVFREISTGSQAFFTVRLNNAGNAVDSYELEIANLQDLVSKGWMVVLSANTVAKVSPGENKTFTVSAQGPQDWTLGKSESTSLIIKATSHGARDNQQNVSLEYSLYARETGSYPVWYNWTTIGLTTVIAVAAVAAGLWMWRRKGGKGGGNTGNAGELGQ